MKTTQPSRNLWPYAIVGWFVCFASALAALVTFTARQKIDLVHPDYYEHEVQYQRQLDRLSRSAPLRGQVSVQYSAASGEIAVRLPVPPANNAIAGRIQFYRPSQAALDFELPLSVDQAGVQRIAGHQLCAGLWKVRVEWTAGGTDFSFEQAIVARAPQHSRKMAMVPEGK